MTKLHALLQHDWFILLLQVVLGASIAVGLLFFPREFITHRRSFYAGLIEIAFVVGCTLLLTVAFMLKKPDANVWQTLLCLAVGVGLGAVYMVVLWLLNKFAGKDPACYTGVALVVLFALACIALQDVVCCGRGKKFPFVLVSVILTVSYCLSVFFSFALRSKGWLTKFLSEDKIQFGAVTAEEMVVSDAEKNRNKTWYETHVVSAVKNGQKPAYDFSLGGRKLSETLSDWSQTTGESYAYADGVATDVILTNAKEKVQATVKTVFYESTATFEWTVYIKNVGDKNSAVVSSFYPLTEKFDVDAPTLYFNGGSDFQNDDFALYARKLNKKTLTLDTVNGRTTQTYLPFFNLSGTKGGLTVGLGWTGEWKADFRADNGVSVVAGQKALSGYLTPGEEIRSPLVSLSFYDGNPLKGFNTFRKRVKASLPDYYGTMKTFAFAGAEGEENLGYAGEEGTKKLVEIFENRGLLDTVNYAWYDAGWFDVGGKGNWNETSGDWEIDPRRYPNGLKAVSDYLHERGIKMILWYEPERIPDKSNIYQTGKENNWLLAPTSVSPGTNNYLWNMGDPAANEYISKYISASIKANGVDFYRQDFNIDPGSYWTKADRDVYGGRTGFAENKYVVGLYAYLDYLVADNPGLLIDNCASGGRRLDLEMCRRSVPLWRSDYNCVDYDDLENASQYQTYGLSLWLPLSNCGNDWAKNEYDYRSFLGAIIECYPSFLNGDPAGYEKFVAEYERIKEYFLQNYYPLTPCTLSKTQTVALQFGDENEGAILVFTRENAKGGESVLKMNGLSKTTRYSLSTIEGEGVANGSGADLMESGFRLKTEKRTAQIVVYKKGE